MSSKIKVTVRDTFVDEKKWSKGDRSGVIRTQEATAECERWRQTVRLDLGKNDPYQPGEYEVDFNEVVTVGQFGDFQIPRAPRMHRVEAAPKLAAAK